MLTNLEIQLLCKENRGRKFNRHGDSNTTSKMIAADTANGIRREKKRNKYNCYYCYFQTTVHVSTANNFRLHATGSKSEFKEKLGRYLDWKSSVHRNRDFHDKLNKSLPNRYPKKKKTKQIFDGSKQVCLLRRLLA